MPLVDQSIAQGWMRSRQRVTAGKSPPEFNNPRAPHGCRPFLGKVASTLLAQMVGGSPLSDRCGRGLRHPLRRTSINTQILNNRIFSDFTADEIDAEMFSERNEHTAQTLRRLTAMVAIAILVTHKLPETDRTVELGQ